MVDAPVTYGTVLMREPFSEKRPPRNNMHFKLALHKRDLFTRNTCASKIDQLRTAAVMLPLEGTLPEKLLKAIFRRYAGSDLLLVLLLGHTQN